MNLRSVTTLVALFTLMTNLEELNLSVLNFKDFNDTFQLKIPKTLKKLSLEFGGYNEFMCPPTTFKTIQRFLELFKSQLESLIIIAINVHDKNFSNYDKFQSLAQNFLRLEKFEYDIITNHEPDPNSLFPNVKHLQDSTYSIYTLPKPQQFDTKSIRVTYQPELYSMLTLQQLFNCQTLKLSGHSLSPTSFQLKDDFKLQNLRKIESDDPIGCCTSQVLQYVAKVIALSPCLNSVKLWSWDGPRSIIDPCHVMFPLEAGNKIKYVDMSTGGEEDENFIPYSTFLTELSGIFPNAEGLRLHIEQRALSNCYVSFDRFIGDLQKNFRKLTHLVFSMWLRDQQAFESYKNELNKLSNQNSLYYTVVDRGDEHDFYIFTIWL